MIKKLNLILICIFLITGVIAGFDYSAHKITKEYSRGDLITGYVNLSLEDESAKTLLTSNLEGNITLINLLKENNLIEGGDFDCDPLGCKSDFSILNEINSIDLIEEDYVGFLVTGNIDSINSISFKIESDKGESCFEQIFVDLLADNENILINDAYTNIKCGVRDYGCFEDENTEEATITTTPYCHNITLPMSPAFSLGARVKDSVDESGLIMSLYDKEWRFLADCELPKQSLAVEDLECIVEHSIKKADSFFVCINSDNSISKYKIKTESKNSCGCAGIECFPETTDFEIFAQPMQFDKVNFNINDVLFEQSTGIPLRTYIHDYLFENYNSECGNGCVVPIRLSGGNQKVSFSEILVEYFADGILKSSEKIFAIEEREAIINSEIIKLELENAGFKINNEKAFTLYLGGERIFTENLNVSSSFDFDISPRFVAIGVNTVFEASGYGKNLSSSKWNFEGDVKQSTNNKIAHRFLEEGTFDLKVTLTREDNVVSSKNFKIIVGDAKSAVNETLDDYNTRLDSIDKTLNNYPIWLQEIIEREINLEENKAEIERLENEYKKSSNYTEIILDLIELEIPKSINVTKKSSSPLIIGYENMDVSIIEEISSNQAEDSELKEAIVIWMQENVDGEIDYEEITAFFDSESDVIATRYNLDVNQKTDSAYLVIGYSLNGVEFDTDYNENSIEGGTYILLEGGRRNIAFAIADEISPQELGVYISPLIDSLEIDFGDIREFEEKGFNWTFFVISLIILLIIGLIVYILLQEWYKKNYEHSLFKKEEDLYNLINFIFNARNSGLNDGQIKLKLKQSKWSLEQIKYAIRKLDGKRTGMFEIPIFKFKEKRKVKEEILKRQQRKVY